jgi:hypothetical protein
VDIYVCKTSNHVCVKTSKLTTFTLETFAAYIQTANSAAREAARAAKYLFSFDALQRYIRWDDVSPETRRKLLECETVQAVYTVVAELCGDGGTQAIQTSVTERLVGYYLEKIRLLETPQFVGPPEAIQDHAEEFARLPRARIRAESPEPLMHFIVFLPLAPLEPADDDNYAVLLRDLQYARISANTYCVSSNMTLYVVGKDEVDQARAKRRANVAKVTKDAEWIYYAGRVRIDHLDFYGILTPYYGVTTPGKPNVAVRVEEGRGEVQTSIRTWQSQTIQNTSTAGSTPLAPFSGTMSTNTFTF